MKTVLASFLMVLALSAFGQNKETRNVRDFDEIVMRMSGNVYVKLGNKNEVVLEGDDRVLDRVETEVRGSKLSIGMESSRSWRSRSNGRVNVYITIKELNGVSISGSGDVIGQSLFKADDFYVSISGSGDMELEVDAKNISARISGSGNIELSGSAEYAKLGMSGSGKYLAEDLKVDDYEITISGSGRSSVNAQENLDVRISGSGSVYYKGRPAVNSSVAGSGKVRRIN
ncbi:head GIN domain-containing protein [Roseivirga sp.]|uniref:head GIN domain-containing protein n=1 Tax=Roseivirga sp. TaxID=1964215 RepID=UPI003B8E9775